MDYKEEEKRILLPIFLFKIDKEELEKIFKKEDFECLPEYIMASSGRIITIDNYDDQYILDNDYHYILDLNIVDDHLKTKIEEIGINDILYDLNFKEIISKLNVNDFGLELQYYYDISYIVLEMIISSSWSESSDGTEYDENIDFEIIGYLNKDLELCEI